MLGDKPDARGWLRVKKYRAGMLYEITPWVSNLFTAHLWRSIVLHWAGMTEAGYPLTLGPGSLCTITDSGGADIDILILKTGYPTYVGDYRAFYLWETDSSEALGEWDNIYVQEPGGVNMSIFEGLSLGVKPNDEEWFIEYEFRVS